MSYFGRTTKYVLRNFFPILIVALIPSIILGLLVSPTSVPAFLVSFVRLRGELPYVVASYPSFFSNYIFGWRTFAYVYPIVLIVLSLIIGGSVIISAIEKHMRVGVMSVKRPLKLLNYSAVPVAITVLAWVILLVLYRFVLFGLALLVNLAAGHIWGLAFVLILIAYIGLFVLLLFLSSPIMLWTPCMMIYGYKFGDAATTSFRMASKRTWSLFVAQAVPFLLLIAARIILELIFAPLTAPIRIIFDIVSCLALLMYYCGLICVAYFDLAEIERKDRRASRY